MQQMFARSSFSNIYFGLNFAPNGSTYSAMFQGCRNIENLDLSTFTSSEKVSDMSAMFTGCKYLKTVKLWGVPTTPQNVSQLFMECCSLNEVDMSNINISSTSSYDSIF